MDIIQRQDFVSHAALRCVETNRQCAPPEEGVPIVNSCSRQWCCGEHAPYCDAFTTSQRPASHPERLDREPRRAARGCAKARMVFAHRRHNGNFVRIRSTASSMFSLNGGGRVRSVI